MKLLAPAAADTPENISGSHKMFRDVRHLMSLTGVTAFGNADVVIMPITGDENLSKSSQTGPCQLSHTYWSILLGLSMPALL